MATRAAAKVTTDHDEIRQWAEERSARPSHVRGTGGAGDIGMLRLDFPGYSGETSLEEISWDDWFDKFDERGLALLHQDTTAQGQKSNFNKLISRGTAESRAEGESKAGVHRGRSRGTSTSRTKSASRTRQTRRRVSRPATTTTRKRRTATMRSETTRPTRRRSTSRPAATRRTRTTRKRTSTARWRSAPTRSRTTTRRRTPVSRRRVTTTAR
ncbi:MAG TPA: hypothetical protein VG897_07695, partial [Terriglobales bacterium]|nr:hypothetical protein [Terriglobales bacterium]